VALREDRKRWPQQGEPEEEMRQMRDDRRSTPSRRPNRQPPTRRISAAAVMVILVTLAALACSPSRDERPASENQPPASERTPKTTAVPEASTSSADDRSEEVTPDGEVVHGWPNTSRNLPGVYSWNGSRCAGPYCTISPAGGFMHNGYGSGDVEIRLEVVPEGTISADGATAVTVAGHDGIYRRIDARREEWIVDIDGTTIAIRLTARPGTSQTDLSDAYAIIESMRTEAQDSVLGFRLLFTLATNEWDSG
jgi:hypothetical protein